ncbi:hypothetical protein Poli38472_007598 [Pythium oligandrum]|uniref:Histidine acid phosphatase n=1 Tax=Pythium oligandrum TaxID=41045 RepID=A0A8K1CQF7_PYTOL|nr:hypothetical protein Poli38472_007598 [Pythium oligandrum]|eukprot:TMW67926.1 hypothetical protein Poli38472_007598 [Pythium oligandrum]
MTDAIAAATLPPPAPSSGLHHAGRDLKLKHVLFFHRHGDRSPILTKIGQKWKMTQEELDFWKSRLATEEQLNKLNSISKVVGSSPSEPPHSPPGQRQLSPLAQLSSNGVEHMIAKGKSLRDKYQAFIEESGLTSNPHDSVYVLSSNIDRTIQSVQCLLYGMFHSDDAQHVDNAPVFYVRTLEKNILAPSHAITIFNEIETIVSDDVAKRSAAEQAEIHALGEHFKQVLGIPADAKVPWTAIRDGLTCRKAHDMPFPEGITEDMFEKLNVYDTWLWHRLYTRFDFCHGAYKEGVAEVYNHLHRVVDPSAAQDSKPKISFFSAHDNSIVALVSALQLQVGPVLPEYGTVVAFEVYQDQTTSESYLHVLFEGRPVAFAGHEHDAVCPFSYFETRAKAFIDGKH